MLFLIQFAFCYVGYVPSRNQSRIYLSAILEVCFRHLSCDTNCGKSLLQVCIQPRLLILSLITSYASFNKKFPVEWEHCRTWNGGCVGGSTTQLSMPVSERGYDYGCQLKLCLICSTRLHPRHRIKTVVSPTHTPPMTYR